jgi:AcrR family transcriptional regulator
MARITKPVEERRQEIIATARKLFIKNGFDTTQTADIAKNINVASGLVYHYFKTKTALLYAVIDQIAEEELTSKVERLCESNLSVVERLSLLLEQRPDLSKYGKLTPSFVREPAIIEYCQGKMVESMKPLLLSLIEEGNADGSWNCEYPQETTMFILRGYGGFFNYDTEKSKFKGDINVLTKLILQTLGISQLNNKPKG